MDVREKLVELVNDVLRYLPWGEIQKDTAERIVDRIMDHDVTVQEWIPVTERLPEQPPNRVDEQGRSWFTTGIYCIVYDGKNVFAAHYCFQNKCFWYTDTLHPLKNITHWMPFPEPPEEDA